MKSPSGFGRTGTMFACEQAGIRPDFLCLSKGLTGGYLPLSTVMTTEAIYAAFYDEYAKLARSCTHTASPATRWAAPRRWRVWRSFVKTRRSSATGRWRRTWARARGNWRITRTWRKCASAA